MSLPLGCQVLNLMFTPRWPWMGSMMKQNRIISIRCRQGFSGFLINLQGKGLWSANHFLLGTSSGTRSSKFIPWHPALWKLSRRDELAAALRM